jgi:hypothetical protein
MPSDCGAGSSSPTRPRRERSCAPPRHCRRAGRLRRYSAPPSACAAGSTMAATARPCAPPVPGIGSIVGCCRSPSHGDRCPGFGAVPRPTELWAAAYLKALAEEAEAGIALLRLLERQWFAARTAIRGRRRDSHAVVAVDILAAAPIISATSLARDLDIAVKNAVHCSTRLSHAASRSKSPIARSAACSGSSTWRLCARKQHRRAARCGGAGAGRWARCAGPPMLMRRISRHWRSG